MTHELTWDLVIEAPLCRYCGRYYADVRQSCDRLPWQGREYVEALDGGAV